MSNVIDFDKLRKIPRITRRALTDSEYMSIIENATHDDCKRIAGERASPENGTLEELTQELYGFVLGDTDSPFAFECFKNDIDAAKQEAVL
jgi:hypothetical protein